MSKKRKVPKGMKSIKVPVDITRERRNLLKRGIYKYVFSAEETDAHLHAEYRAIDGWRVQIVELGTHWDSVVPIKSAETVPFPESSRIISGYRAAYSELEPYGEVPM